VLSDNAFWLLAFALYSIDHIKLIDQRELVLHEDVSLNWHVVLAAIPFELRRRCVIILNPFCPFAMAFKMRWMIFEGTNPRALRKDRKSTLSLQRRALPLRVLVAVSFITFFICGPIFTGSLGLGRTLLLLAPIHAVVIAMIILVVVRDRLGLPLKQWAALITECTFCPMYCPALLKRLSWRTPLTADGLAFAKRYVPVDFLPELELAAQTRMEDTLEACDDAIERDEITKYRNWAFQ